MKKTARPSTLASAVLAQAPRRQPAHGSGMALGLCMPVEFIADRVLRATIFGGPFRQYQTTRRLVGIKMAEEIDHPSDLNVDTPDFGLPTTDDMDAGILFGLKAMLAGNDIYVGCMGGTGRTGTYMACMAKVMHDWNDKQRAPGLEVLAGVQDPVLYVRKHYKPHAVETEAQEAFCRAYDTTDALTFLAEALLPKVVVKEVPKIEVVYQDRVTEVFLSPWEWAMRAMGLTKPL